MSLKSISNTQPLFKSTIPCPIFRHWQHLKSHCWWWVTEISFSTSHVTGGQVTNWSKPIKVQTWRAADLQLSEEMLIINIIYRCRFAVSWRSRPAGLSPVSSSPGTLSRFTTSQSIPYSPGLRQCWRRRSRACWRTLWTGVTQFWRVTPAAAPRPRREWRAASTSPRAPLGSRTWTVVTGRERRPGAETWQQQPGNTVVKAVQGNVAQEFVLSSLLQWEKMKTLGKCIVIFMSKEAMIRPQAN